MRHHAVVAAFAWLGLSACAELPGDIGNVAAVVLSVTDTTITLGDSTRLHATAVNAAGQPVAGAPLSWSSNDLLIAHVDSGRVISVGAGMTSIVAESRGRSAIAEITIHMQLRSVAGGGDHTCGVTEDGRVACWGSNSAGQLGNGTLHGGSTPAIVFGARDIVDVVAGGAHSCAIAATREVLCWGRNSSGQLGLGLPDPQRHDVPAPTVGDIRFASLTAGSRHVCGLRLDGAAYCWGGGFSGQLGTSAPQTVCPIGEPCNPQPGAVDGGLQFSRLVAGSDHTCGLTLGGEAYCWGWNEDGQLGDSTRTDRMTPTPVIGGFTFTDIAAGLFHNCALATDGQAYCWGSNRNNRLGISDTLQRSFAPIPISGPHRFTALVAGEDHTCGIAASSFVWCWGYNTRGQLGSPDALQTDEPVRAQTPPLATISSGAGHVCGRALDNRVYCWGENTSGQLGTIGFSRTAAAAVVGQP